MTHWYDEPDTDGGVAAATAAFRDAYGGEPEGVWAAPGRVNVIGEHVDYNGGLCLPFALPHRTFVALRRRDDGMLRVRSAQVGSPWSGRLADVAPGRVRSWAGYAVGVPWALARHGAALPEGLGFDATVVSHVPVGSGLSSSAALECAVAVALDELCGLGLAGSDEGRSRLAQACVDAENEIAGAPTGGMDQAASLRATPGHALLLDCTDLSVRQVPFDCAAAGLELLVIDTRVHHALVDGQYGSRREQCTEAARLLGVARLGEIAAADLDDALARIHAGLDDPDQADETARRVRHVVTEVDRVRRTAQALDDGRLREIGPLMDASHASLRDDYEVSCAELDVACEAALGAGALGARMTGGGFGGSAIALVEASRVDAVAGQVTQAFADKGFDAPAFLHAVPSAAAGRVG